jgi:hypothetical protein
MAYFDHVFHCFGSRPLLQSTTSEFIARRALVSSRWDPLLAEKDAMLLGKNAELAVRDAAISARKCGDRPARDINVPPFKFAASEIAAESVLSGDGSIDQAGG